MPKNFTIARGTDVRIRFPLMRDGVEEYYGSSPSVRFTVEGVATLSNEGDTPRITVSDALDNEAIVFLPAATTAATAVGTYRAECIVKLDDDDEQCVWRGEVTFFERLTAAIA